MYFKNYLNFIKLIENNKIIYLPENFDWVKSFIPPSINLDLPSVEKSGKIQIIMDKINPIYIGLSDGSKLFFTIDEFSRITGKPMIGKTMIWKMQRLPNDSNCYPSKITMCKVI